MKEKGFTLIELLAVIVILAIIALIAVPIVLNIIDNSKQSSEKRSKELYLDAVEQAIARKNLTSPFNPTTCTVIEKGNLNCDAGELTIEISGQAPKVGGTITFKDGKIIGNTLEIGTSNENGEIPEEPTNLICTLVSGTSKTVGAKYTCAFDEERTFYVLENNETSNEITLLMDRNYTDAEIPERLAWCNSGDSNSMNNNCNHNGIDSYIEKVQTKFGNKVKVGLPSYEQMLGIGCTTDSNSCPAWSYDHLLGTTIAQGYWTSTGDSSDYTTAWCVIYTGDVSIDFVVFVEGGGGDLNGFRPIITVSKTLIN